MKARLTNNLILKILAFFFAIFLWIIVVSIDDPLTTKVFRNIPVTVANEDVVTNNGKTYQVQDSTQNVTVTVKARRSVISKVSAADIQATADMKDMELASMIPIHIGIKGYEGQYEEAYATPTNMQVSIEDTASNKFPITVATTGTLRDGYALGEVTTNPETVTINGPESMVNSISKVMARVDISGLSESTSVTADLQIYDSEENIIDQTLLSNNLGDKGVTVDIHLLRTKSVGLNFDTGSIAAAEGYVFTGITYEPQTVNVVGDENDLSDLEALEIPSEALQLQNLSRKTEAVVNLKDWLPKGISLMDETADSVAVTVTVEQAGSKTFDVQTGSIVINNSPKNLKVNYGDVAEIEMQVQGPEETLETLSIERKVYLDLTNYQTAGEYDVPISIDLPDDCHLVQQKTVHIKLEKQ